MKNRNAIAIFIEYGDSIENFLLENIDICPDQIIFLISTLEPSHQNLFSNERNKNKWILLCFNSSGEENEWNTEYLKYDIGKVNESTFFENKFFQSK